MDSHRFIIVLVLLVAALSFPKHDGVAQTAETAPDSIEAPLPKISAIVIIGNNRTKKSIILREMKTRVGDTVDPKILEGDQKRILNLGLFSRVEIQGVPTEKGIQLIISVDERWPIYPFPIFFLNDRDWGKLSYGAGILHFNFRGRREVVAASGWAGYNPALNFDYSNPWMLGKTHLFGRLGFFVQRVQNRFLESIGHDIDEKRIGGRITIGKRFGHFTYLSLHFGYSQLRITSPEGTLPDDLVTDTGRLLTLTPPDGRTAQDNLPTYGFSFLYDARDLHEYPRAGTYFRIWAMRTGINDRYVHYLRYGFDVRRYQKIIGDLSLGARVMAELSHDIIPAHDLVSLGFRNRVRGHFHTTKFGDRLALGSVELRVPILPISYHPLQSVSGIGSTLAKFFGPYLKNIKLGVSAGAFVDYGIVWDRSDDSENGSFEFNKGLKGVGAGLHFHLPLIDVLRVEWARSLNADGGDQIIFDYGVSF